MNKNNNTPHKTSIGGQALIEGVMMRGPENIALAVRKSDGEITVEDMGIKQSSFMRVVAKIPIIRGMFNFISSLVIGYKSLSRSIDLSGLAENDEEPETKFEKWLSEKLGDKLVQIVTVIGSVLGVILAILLFMLVPSAIVKLIDYFLPLGGFKSLIEGIIKMGIFIGYLTLISKMKDIKRVFEYHGAEHKTIFCYEYGMELTVENVKKQSRFHPRCGTNFMILLLIISIVLFSVITWDNLIVRMILKILLLPLVMGIGYELLKLAGRYDNIITRIISWPGIMLQHVTTSEPDESQIEVAIESLKAVLPKSEGTDKW